MDANPFRAARRPVSFRSLFSSIAPVPVKRLARRMFLWRRRSQFQPYIMTKAVRGDTFPFYIGDAVAHAWYGGGNDRSPELGFIRDQMLSAEDLVFDVGSHHGLVAIALARRCARVLAVEPNPYNVAILQRNIDLNYLQNVQICREAAGDSTGEVELLLDSLDGGVATENREALPTTTVPLVRLDDLADEHGFPSLIKIDVEGFEHEALRGAPQILARRPKIAIEIHTEWISRYGSSVEEVLTLLGLEQYDAWVMPHGSPVVLPWKGEDYGSYPPPKFNLFLIPRNTSSR